VQYPGPRKPRGGRGGFARPAGESLGVADPGDQDPAGDASRRTHLANERTFLAWWRSGLTALGVSLAVGRIIPAFGHTTRWPYAALGAAYAVFGLAMVLYGTARQREVEEAVRVGGFSWPERRLVGAFTLLAAGIGLATLVLVVVNV
jgi:putative membrane protein